MMAEIAGHVWFTHGFLLLHQLGCNLAVTRNFVKFALLHNVDNFFAKVATLERFVVCGYNRSGILRWNRSFSKT